MPENTRNCPRCIVPLRAAKGPNMVVDMCTECGGAYFDNGELSRLTRRQPEAFDKLEALVKEAPTTVERVDGPSLTCPGCAKPMARYEYALASGIMLDRCGACYGVWVDGGELAQIGEHLLRGQKVMDGAESPEPTIGTSHHLTQNHMVATALTGAVSTIAWPEHWL